jgi:hypothetical protein
MPARQFLLVGYSASGEKPDLLSDKEKQTRMSVLPDNRGRGVLQYAPTFSRWICWFIISGGLDRGCCCWFGSGAKSG